MNTLPFLKAIEQGTQQISIGGLWGSSKAYLIALARQQYSQPCVVVTPSQKRAEEMYEDLMFFCRQLSDSEVYLFSQWDITPYEQASPHREIVSERLTVLDKLLNNENIIVVAPVEAVMHRTLPKAALNEFTLYLGVGEELDRQQLLAGLVDTGYKHATLVENRGESSAFGAALWMCFRPLAAIRCALNFLGMTLNRCVSSIR
jgi:transcription-repair coupling factor (superfamily II helicase)